MIKGNKTRRSQWENSMNNQFYSPALANCIVLDIPRHSSATKGLDQLGWDNLTKRFHRLILLPTPRIGRAKK